MMAQGWLFGRPVAAEAFLELLAGDEVRAAVMAERA
jgi:sensor c-di-GMP phosphodiesterase-like protein